MNYETHAAAPSWRRRALMGLVLASVAAQPVIAQSSPSAAAAEEPHKLEAFAVTGSRIKRIDAEGPNPVTAFTQDDLAISGYSNVGDALRTLPMVSGTSLMPAASNNSFTPGASTVNMRGLGNNNVLVLLNGRRAAPLASPGFDGLQTVFDLNSIPSAAVESIEVLKDGGSAIYGSDAVSGVIDVKLKKNYSGLTTNFEIGNTLNTDSFEKSFSLVSGTSDAKNSIITVLDWRQRKSIKDRDYGFSSNANLTSRGGPDRRSYAGFPGMVYVPSLEDYYTLPAPMERPRLTDFVVADVSHGSYNFQSVTDLLPEVTNYGFYTRARHDFDNGVYAFAELSFRRNRSVIGAAPAPVFNYNEHGTGPKWETLNIPKTNPNNPFGEDLEDEWYARLVAAGNRINDVTSDSPRLLAGLGGEIEAESTWTWESAVMHSSNEVTNLNRGSVFDDLYQDALNGLTIGGEKLYANPFGPEDPRVTAYYVHEDPNTSTFKLETIDANISGKLLDLPWGQPLGLALGGEFRTEDFENIRSKDNITGNIIGGAEGASVWGDRRVGAAYIEFSVPIFKGLETQLAARSEHYSDFGTTTKPKIAVSYRVAPWLLLRASFGQSFLAPNLSYLYTSQVTQFSDSGLEDPKRPDDAPKQIMTRSGGNPNLQPEETDTYYVGAQFEPTAFVKGLSVSVDAFQFNQSNLITQLGAEFILKNEDILPGQVVRNAPAAGETYGTINHIVDTYQNVAKQRYRGLDVEVAYDLKTSALGQFRFVAAGTYLEEFTFDGTDFAGTYNQPRLRGVFTTSWRKGNWSASAFLDYIGKFENYNEIGDMPAHVTINPQVSYTGFRRTKVTLGARNLLDRDPPFDRQSSTGWNSNIHNPEQVFVYLRVTKDW